jgi:hypothetical protein
VADGARVLLPRYVILHRQLADMSNATLRLVSTNTIRETGRDQFFCTGITGVALSHFVAKGAIGVGGSNSYADR